MNIDCYLLLISYSPVVLHCKVICSSCVPSCVFLESASPTSFEEKKAVTAERASYDEFLKSTRAKEKQEPLFEKVGLPQEKDEDEGLEDDMEMEDVSLDDL